VTTLPRRSPKQSNYTADDIKIAFATLEDRPRIPEATPASSSADGFEGQVCADGTYLYVYRNGSWKRAALSSF